MVRLHSDCFWKEEDDFGMARRNLEGRMEDEGMAHSGGQKGR